MTLINENGWKSTKLNEIQWNSMKIDENRWKSMKILWIMNRRWKSMKINEINETLWKSISFNLIFIEVQWPGAQGLFSGFHPSWTFILSFSFHHSFIFHFHFIFISFHRWNVMKWNDFIFHLFWADEMNEMKWKWNDFIFSPFIRLFSICALVRLGSCRPRIIAPTVFLWLSRNVFALNLALEPLETPWWYLRHDHDTIPLLPQDSSSDLFPIP